MNINKLISNVEREIEFEAAVKADPEILTKDETKDAAERFKRGCGEKRVYTPFSERLQKGITASVKVRTIKIRYYINTKVVSAMIEESGHKIKRVAKCHPDDKFSVKRGILIATARAITEFNFRAVSHLNNIVDGCNRDLNETIEGLKKHDAEAIVFAFKK